MLAGRLSPSFVIQTSTEGPANELLGPSTVDAAGFADGDDHRAAANSIDFPIRSP